MQYRNAAAAIVGLAALFVCILACTSFSPDDKQILYPTLDPQSRSVGVGVYDRASRKSKMLFVIKVHGDPVMVRSQWLPDGKRVVLTWNPSGGPEEGSYIETFAVLSIDGKEPVRLFSVGGEKKNTHSFFYPLAIMGTRAFVNRGEAIVALDLVTGETEVQTNNCELAVYCSPVPGRFGFIEALKTNQFECGLLEPKTMKKDWRVQLKIEHHIDNIDSISASFHFFAFSPVGRKVAFTGLNEDTRSVQVYEAGQPPKALAIPAGREEEIDVGQVEFARDGRALFVAFQSRSGSNSGQCLGIFELPLDGRPPVRMELIRGTKSLDVTVFQFGLSHDGKALAVSSAYSAIDKDEDYALFIIDLASAKRPVTKIPIPLPTDAGKRSELGI